ncbi:MAG TPA: bifunctional demethylmenaquinone methyltransferase/2-methoxy-6-polyprenyl-1,4-benzoquinol methylase UbiE [Chloroflexota bacterium]|nr:bifunctional demethylmenaquinone methyltransferase/2-methoxy-6-polyprenyl-1,4-benzoquinol methylase UbiE [Chloroflexota bacterium]
MTELRADARREYVARMFGAIADRYDLMNWVMTLGQDQRWRRQAAEIAMLRPDEVALDVATGTADLAIELASVVAPRGHVVGIDISEEMLEIGRRKVQQHAAPIALEIGDALNLAFGQDSFDAVSCGFGLRNVADRPRALTEMTRVVKPGRRVVILELTPPTNQLARQYIDTVIPRLGQLIARARDAYTYLPESVQDFPNAAALGRMMQGAGLRQVTYRLLNFGTIALHWGTKPVQ